jgi:hypothetical protein
MGKILWAHIEGVNIEEGVQVIRVSMNSLRMSQCELESLGQRRRGTRGLAFQKEQMMCAEVSGDS